MNGGFRGGGDGGEGGGVGVAGCYSYWLEPEGVVLSLPSGCDAYRLFHFDCMLYARPTRLTNVLKYK